MTEHSNSHARREEHIPGVTHDPALRPVGTVLVIVGVLWLLFWGMASQAGTYAEVKAAAALILLGVVLIAVGKRELQI